MLVSMHTLFYCITVCVFLVVPTFATTPVVCSVNHTPQERHYKFVVEYYSTLGPACGDCPGNSTSCEHRECITADGIQRAIIVVNRQMPGPIIDVCQGDTVIVDVENRLMASETSVHWHGLLQRGTPYMDGATFITQCPIPEGTTFRYTFVANELGTYFWHSHHGPQKMDGFTGSLIVRSGSDPSLGLYDTDNHIITLQDWTHELTQGKMPGPISMARRGQQANSLLINGRGKTIDPVTGSSTKTPLAEIKVQSGLKHRMRIINMGCFECPFHVQVEGHRLSVIAVDGFPVKPVTVDTIILLPGERVDVVLNANQPAAAYWIIVKALADCEDSSIHQKAVLVYESAASHVPTTPDPGYAAFPAGVVRLSNVNETSNLFINGPMYMYYASGYGPMLIFQVINGAIEAQVISLAHCASTSNITQCIFSCLNYILISTMSILNPMEAKCRNGEQGVCSYQLQAMVPPSSPDPVLTSRDTNQMTLAFSFLTYEHGDIFNQDYIAHKPFYIPRDGDENNYELQAGQINNISMVLPTSPPLSQPHILQRTLNKNSKLACKSNTNKHQNCFHYKQVPLNSILDVLLIHDSEGEEGEAHPMHLHGYKFYVLYQGYSLEDSKNASLFTTNPVLKDTVNVPGSGIARIRFKADNPGFWLLHCHIVFHQLTGMSMLLHVGDLNQLPPKPHGFPTCGNFLP